MRLERSSTPPADLEIHVERTLEGGKDALRYQLSSPSGVVPYQYQTFQGEAMLGSPEAFEKLLREQMHRLGSGLDAEGQALLESEIPEELATLGQRLYEQLFPKTLRDAYRRFRHSVETILVVTDQHWIPWELIKPFDDSDPDDPIDDDFLCLQFQLTRWLPGEVEHAAPSRLRPCRGSRRS